MKSFMILAVVAAALSVGCSTDKPTVASSEDCAACDASSKTITGKSACATCEGVTKDGHAILLVDKTGMRWVLVGEGEHYKAAHEHRKEGKTITATLAGEPITKKDSEGKEFKEVKVSDVKIDA